MAPDSRIMVYDDKGTYRYKYLTIENFSMQSNNQIYKMHPAFIRFAGEIVEDVLGIEFNNFPSFCFDFGKWDEVISITGILYAGAGVKNWMADISKQYSELRNWIMDAQLEVDNALFLQLYPQNLTDNESPDVAFDTREFPMTAAPSWGYRGMITAISLETWNAFSCSAQYKLTWQCGYVVSI